MVSRKGNVRLTSVEKVVGELRRIRKEQRKSQEEVAAACDLTQTGISLIESGRTSPQLETIIRMAAALGCWFELKRFNNQEL